MHLIFPHAQNVPTTGFAAIMVALRLCDEVSVAGFGYNLKEPNSLLHYYSQGEKMSLIKQSFTHNIPMETKTLYKLVQQGIIVDLTNGIHLGLWVRFRRNIERRNFDIIFEYPSYTPSCNIFCDKCPSSIKCPPIFQKLKEHLFPPTCLQITFFYTQKSHNFALLICIKCQTCETIFHQNNTFLHQNANVPQLWEEQEGAKSKYSS